jgi:uncharacterized membrane protein YfhO
VRDITVTGDGSNIRFNVNSRLSTPVLVKVLYSKDWHATADGKPVTIYRATPSHMLIIAKGNVELEYKPGTIYLFGGMISIVALVLLCFSKRENQKRGSRNNISTKARTTSSKPKRKSQ